jgi:hypothetical protein
VDGHGDGFAREGLFRFKLLFDGAQGGHKILDPLNLHAPMLRQGHISNDAHYNICLSSFFVSIPQNTGSVNEGSISGPGP